jgi:hypothetical protein
VLDERDTTMAEQRFEVQKLTMPLRLVLISVISFLLSCHLRYITPLCLLYIYPSD